MAEAGDSAPTKTGRFFCHNCSEDLSHVLEDFTCPKCKSGFVEKLSDAPSNASQGASSATAAHVHEGDFFQNVGLPFLELFRGLTRDMELNISDSSGSVQRANPASGSGPRSPDMNFSFVMDVRPRAGNQPAGPGAGGVPANSQANTGHNAEQPINSMENILFSFLNDLTAGLSLPMMDELDAIFTQVINQMEVTGPPPMPTDKIDHLTTVKISQEQVDRKLQCSVCLDDFNLHEQVKQLECDHVFHPDCIVPWLKLHGTCPICRKDLTKQGDGSGAPSARFEPPEPRSYGNLI